MAKELASVINEADCMPFPDELNLSTSIQPSESLSQPIPSSSGLSEMSQINPTPSKQPKISDTAESGQYSSMLIDAQPSVMISDAQHPPMNVSNETASSTVTRGTKRGKGKSAGNKEKCPAKRKGKVTKRKSSHKNIENSCSICSRVYIEGSGDDWILCDTCDSWFDRHCAGLDHDELWNHYTETNRHYDCPLCQTGN
jgi:hypothetical protein